MKLATLLLTLLLGAFAWWLGGKFWWGVTQ